MFYMLFPVFPAANQSIAGVFQVSRLNALNQPQYAFNASEARVLCLFLGVNIASKAQVQEALTRGFETCRWDQRRNDHLVTSHLSGVEWKAPDVMLLCCIRLVLFRFGWIDEHLAVIPRSKALSNCGRNQIGLVTWRANVAHKFDVFCFNESGMTFLYAYFIFWHHMLYTTH